MIIRRQLSEVKPALQNIKDILNASDESRLKDLGKNYNKIVKSDAVYVKKQTQREILRTIFENIRNQKSFSIFWLLQNGLKISFKLSKLTKISLFASFMNWITPTKKTFNGHNTSCFKKDLLAVNGFNEDMKYGGLDRELGERLFNLGILSKQIRYAAICIHLNHERSYFNVEDRKNNDKIRFYNKVNKIIKIKNGIEKL
jgi:hypothetical protein